MAWIPELSCGSGSQTGADILTQVNNISAILANAIFATNDISNFNIVTGLGSGNFLGFALCNGLNGTPNLQGAFIVGRSDVDADYVSVGAVGGAKKIALTWQQSGSRDHKHSQYRPEIYVGGGANGAVNNVGTVAPDPALQTTGGEWKNGGVDATEEHENRPPYFVLAYYKKII